MDITLLKQKVEEQLLEKGIEDNEIYVLEKDWGYIVESKSRLNEVFDKEGNIIYPLGYIETDPGEIYSTEIEEVELDGQAPEIYIHKPKVSYVKLDSEHFIIPRTENGKCGNALFFLGEDMEVMYKGNIEGRIKGNILGRNKELIEQKQVLSEVIIDEAREDYEQFFYSWDRNCIVSDRWSYIIEPDDSYMTRRILVNDMRLTAELADGIFAYMQENNAWLSTLNLNSKDNKHHRRFVCLIGIDGKPLIDLTYVSQMYKVETIELQKDKIGEVDEIRRILQDRMDMQVAKLEENKQSLASNFFKTTGITMDNDSVKLIGDSVESDKSR